MTEPQNNLQKNIGITLGVLVMFGVLSATIFLGKKSTDVSATDQTGNLPIPSTTSQNPSSPAKIPNAPTVTTPQKPIIVNNDENDDENSGTQPSSQTPPPASAPVVTTPPPAVVPKKIVYKDGTYTATGSYMSPGGYDQIAITLTLKNDIITGASAVSHAGDNTSQRYQDKFIGGFQQYVVGQNIASLHLSKVSGASLTPIGFNDALAQIKTKAKA
jgi:uncharacterized protein with FMN-binding domain